MRAGIGVKEVSARARGEKSLWSSGRYNLDLSLVAEAVPAVTRGAGILPSASPATIHDGPWTEKTKLAFPYAASTLLSLTALDINLDLSLVTEAIPAITRGAANPFFAPAAILEWPRSDMAVLSFPFMAKLSVPYAVSTLLSRAMLTARDINLDLSLVAEAIPAITRGAANLPSAPVATILDWPLSDMAKLSARMSGRLYKDRMAGIFKWLTATPCPQHDVWLHALAEHMTQLSGAWLTTIPRAYSSLLPKHVIDAGIRARLLMPIIDCAAPSGVCSCGSLVVRDARFARDSDSRALMFCGDDGRAMEDDAHAEGEEPGVTAAARAARAAAGAAAVQAARERNVADAFGARVQPESAHAAHCVRSVLVRCKRHKAAVTVLARSFRADGARVRLEAFTFAGNERDRRRSDWFTHAYVGADGKERLHGQVLATILGLGHRDRFQSE
jgi:hypothetical protein